MNALITKTLSYTTSQHITECTASIIQAGATIRTIL